MKKEISAVLAERLDGLMAANGELGSQQKLAKKTKIGQTTIGRIRRGEVSATIDNVKAIADAFGVTVGYLCGEEAAESPSGGPFGSRLSQLPPEKAERVIDHINAYLDGVLEEWPGGEVSRGNRKAG